MAGQDLQTVGRAGHRRQQPGRHRAFLPAPLPPTGPPGRSPTGPALSNKRAQITDQLGRAAGSGHKALESLFDRPIVSVADIQQVTGTTYAAANNVAARLRELGILEEITGYSRNRRFRYEPYVRLFLDEQWESAPRPGPS